MLSILFLNDSTGEELTGNYRWKVMINDTTIAKGELKNHNRVKGWKGLIRKFAKECCKNER
jgi:hypothetical protein